MRGIGIFAAILAAALAATAPAVAQAPAGRDRDANILTVSGTGEVHVTPDRARVALGVETRAPKAADAIAQNNKIMGQVVDAIRKLDIADKNIQTSTFSVNREYEPQPPNSKTPPKAVFVVSNIVTVTLDNPSRVGTVIDAGTGAGANTVQGVSFFVENDEPARLQALRDAARQARAKADAIAQALGARISGVESIYESSAPVVYEQNLGLMVSRAEAKMAAPTPVLPGENIIRATVTVRFRIGE